MQQDAIENIVSLFKMRTSIERDRAFFLWVRNLVQKRVKIVYFSDAGSGDFTVELVYKHWWYNPFYKVFKNRRRILSECVTIVIDKYLLTLTSRKVKNIAYEW